MRSTTPRRVIAALLAVTTFAGLGLGLARAHRSRMEPVWKEEGRILYWHVRRTFNDFRPNVLLHQLYARAEDRDTVFRFLALQPGERVADVGCGSGYYTFDLARAVGPDGQVLALDIQEDSVAFLQERLEFLGCEGCAPVRTWVSRADDAGLPEASVDVALLSNLDFYAFPDQLAENVRMLESCFRGLRPGGRAVVVQDLSVNRGSAADHIEAAFVAVGFERVDFHAFEEPSVLFVFRRPEG